MVRVGENLTVTYSGAGTGKNEYVSAMLADNSGNILYYGRIAQNSANGTASVIPSDLTAGTYTLKVFSEQYNGDYKTDYASEFQNITLTVNGKVSEQFNLTPGTTYWLTYPVRGFRVQQITHCRIHPDTMCLLLM